MNISYSEGSDKNDVFYKFTATDAGEYIITLTKSYWPDDIDLGLYSDCSATTALAELTANNITETMTFNCAENTTYLIRVTDWSDTGGSFTISLTCPTQTGETWYIGYPTETDVIATFNNGTLTISGTGEMQDFDPAARPWVDIKDNITSIAINNGVTTIGNGAFEQCSDLTSVTIPNSVTKIGIHAFLDCPKLTFLPNGMGNSVQEIQYGAFDKCSSLASINIPNSVHTIAQWAFAFMDALSSVTVHWATPLTLPDGSVFASINLSNVTLNVPDGTQCAYADALVWQDFKISPTCTITGIEENTVQDLQIFPNPANNEIFIQSELPITRVEICTITGMLLLVENNISGKISVSTLPQGVYVFKIYTDKGVAIKKVVKE